MIKTIRVSFDFDDEVLKLLIKRCGSLEGLKQTLIDGAIGEVTLMCSQINQTEDERKIMEGL